MKDPASPSKLFPPGKAAQPQADGDSSPEETAPAPNRSPAGEPANKNRPATSAPPKDGTRRKE